MKIISFYNYKGGTGKTTSSINLAKGLANKGYRTLVIDLDGQANASSKLINNNENLIGIAEVFDKKIDISKAIYNTTYENLFIIPSKLELEDIKESMNNNCQITILKKNLDKLEGQFDYVILDNNPSYRIMLRNCVYATDLMIVPVNVDSNSIKGVDLTIRRILETIDESITYLDVKIKVLLTKATRTKASMKCVEDITGAFGDKMLNTVIKFQAAPAEKQTFEDDYFMVDHPEKGVGTDYYKLVEEIEKELKDND